MTKNRRKQHPNHQTDDL